MPADGPKPKHKAVSMAKCESDRHTTKPCHCDRCTGMVRYTSATSWTAPWEPGGSEDISNDTMGNVLYAAVNSSGETRAFMDCTADDPLGCERSWIMRYFPGRPGLGIMERGED